MSGEEEALWVAVWEIPGEDTETSLHRSQASAIQALEEEVAGWRFDGEFSFEPSDLESLEAGATLGFPEDDPDDEEDGEDYIYVSLRRNVVQP